MTKNTLSKVLMATALGTVAVFGASLIEDQSACA
jgi:hypothetical protein